METIDVSPLTELLYSGQFQARYQAVQQIFADERYHRKDGISLPERGKHAYALLRHTAKRIGTTSDVVRDPHRLFALFEWSCTYAPDLIPLISGHYNLTVGSLLALGKGRTDLQHYLDDLNTAASVGVLLVTEYNCGSNLAFLETIATYDPQDRSFVLHTPHPGARKFMPNVGASVPRVTIVGARLMIDGKNRGVFPFILRMREADGSLAPGVTIVPLTDKPFLAMDNSVVWFDRVRIPFEGWLPSTVAEIDEEGTFRFLDAAGPGDAFRHTFSQLNFGRVALSSCAVASARASLLILTRHAQNREVRAFHRFQKPMLTFRNMQHSLYGALALTYACTFFANHVKDTLADAADLSDPDVQLLGMVAKPFLQLNALQVIQEVRHRCGAHGLFAANRIPDYLGLCHAAMTGEGDCQVLSLTAGRHLVRNPGYAPEPVPTITAESLEDSATWLELFRAREHHYYDKTATALRGPIGEGRTVFDRWNDCIPDAMQLTDSHANRLALETFLAAVDKAPDTTTHTALRLTARLYVLDYLRKHGGWYLAEDHITRGLYRTLDTEYTATCDHLAEHLPLLIDAFAIDEKILNAPITSPDYINAWEERSKNAAAHWTTTPTT